MLSNIIPIWALIGLLISTLIFIVFYIYKNYTFKKYQGAYFLPTKNIQIKTIVKFIKKNKSTNDKYIDLGAGTGKVVKKLLKETIHIEGIEINPWLVLLSKILLGKHSKNIKQANMWEINLATYDGIIIYALPKVMDKFYEKIKKEVTPDSIIVSIRFPIQKLLLKQIHQENEVYFYKI